MLLEDTQYFQYCTNVELHAVQCTSTRFLAIAYFSIKSQFVAIFRAAHISGNLCLSSEYVVQSDSNPSNLESCENTTKSDCFSVLTLKLEGLQ